MSSICFWLFLIFISSASSVEDVKVANEYIDKVLNTLRETEELVMLIDPIKVPDINEDKFIGKDIWIRGLSSLNRSDDCGLTINDDIYNVTANIAVSDVAIDLEYSAKAGFLWISGVINGNLDRLAISMQANFDYNNGTVHLQEFKVTEFGAIYVSKITGLTFLLNWLYKIIVNIVVRKSRPRIVEAMETEVSKALAAQLGKIRFPLKDIINN